MFYFANDRMPFPQCYERILAVEPSNVQGLHNLCVVYVERGELAAAETCLSRAHAMAPHEDYILRHLKIVRSRLAKFSQMQQQQQAAGAQDRAASTGAAPDAGEGVADGGSDASATRPKKTVFITKNSDSNSKNTEKQPTPMMEATLKSEASDSLS